MSFSKESIFVNLYKNIKCIVVHRAEYLFENGFGCHNVFENNSEDFAIYCKTGILVVDQGTMGQTKPSPSKGGLLQSKRLVTTNIYEMAAAAAVGVYCASRNAAYKVPVEVLTRRLAGGNSPAPGE